MTKSLVLALCLIVAGASCVPTETSAYRRTPTPTPAASGPAAGITREPAGLVVLPGETAVVSAFARGGMPVRMIGASKSEGLLGTRLPARVFTAATTWGAGGADILFLDGSIGDIRVCATPATTNGWTLYTISVDGLPVQKIEAGQLVLFSIGPGFFVQAFDTRTNDALRQGLDLEAPRC
jgi:hypothetical protein